MPDTILQFLCRRATGHRWRKLTAYSVGIEPVEYHYTCRVCRKNFWNFDCKDTELQKFIQKIMPDASFAEQKTEFLKAMGCEIKNYQESEVLDLEVKKEGEG